MDIKASLISAAAEFGIALDSAQEEQFNTYTTDGLHLNDAGHCVLAQRLKDFIDAL